MSKRREKAEGDLPVDDQTAVDRPTPEPEPPAPPVEDAPPVVGAAETGVDAIARVMQANMTPATPEAVAAIRQENAPAPEAATPAAEPVKRGRGRPKGSGKSTIKVAGAGTKPVDASSPQSAAPDPHAAHAMTAATMTSLTVMLGTIIGGEDFKPGPNPLCNGMNDSEILQGAYFDYCKAKNWGDLPPGIALTSALLIYIAPRFTKPATQSKVKSLGVRAWLWVKGIGRKKKQEIPDAAQPISGDDGERKNDPRESALQSVQAERDRVFGPRPNFGH